jgi:thiol-disulfide isomerase/thioredoxin
VEGYQPHFAADGKALFTALPGGVIKLWDAATGRERAAVRRDAGLWAQFSPDGRLLLTHGYFLVKADGRPELRGLGLVSKLHILPIDVRLWDVATGKELARLPGMDKFNPNAGFSPDGKTIVYPRLEPNETDREELVLWDVEVGKERLVLHARDGVRSGVFSPDGKLLFTGDATGDGLKVWDPATGRRLPDVPGTTDAARWQLSPDGRLFATSPGRGRSFHPGAADLVVYRLSDRRLPPPVVRGRPAQDSPVPPPAPPQEPRRTQAAQALADLQKESEAAAQGLSPKIQAAKTDAERKPLLDEYAEADTRFAARAVRIARDYPSDPAAVEALEFALHHTSGGSGGPYGKVRDEALALVRKGFLRSPGLTRVVYFIAYQGTDPAFDLLAEIAEANPDHAVKGRAAYLLAEALAQKAEHARLLRATPDLLKQPELQEKRAMLEELGKADPDALDRQAERWYTRVKGQYADVVRPEAEAGTLGDAAERALFALHHLGLGKVAPDIEGEDLDGKRFKLSDYRGRVVVLIFCGDWCGPCRAMNPQKQRLVERLAGKPFALLEVNSDEDREAVKRTMRKEGLTWRCWFDGGREGPIARRWNVHSWPTIYVLDARGVIRSKELREQPLDDAVAKLVREAEGRRP